MNAFIKKIRKHGLKRIVFYFLYYALAIHLPYGDRWEIIGTISHNFRTFVCRRLFKKAGTVFGVGKNVDFGFSADRITMGERANIGNHAWIRGNGELILGNDIMMGEFVLIYTQDHKIVGTGYDGNVIGNVAIGNNAWIGGRVTIVKGVTIGDNVVIGAGSVVTRDIPSNSIAVGNPARVIKTRVNKPT